VLPFHSQAGVAGHTGVGIMLLLGAVVLTRWSYDNSLTSAQRKQFATWSLTMPVACMNA